MRQWLFLPFCAAAAACSGGGDGSADNVAAAAPPASFPAGQYAVDSEVTSFRSTDNREPAIKAAQGDKASATACVEAGQLPPPEMFAGEGYQCSYKSSYMRDGTINAGLGCTRKGVTGDITMTVQGSYTADSFEATVDTTTYLPGPGDFAMSRKVNGRLTGPTCAAAPEGDAGGNGSAAKTG